MIFLTVDWIDRIVIVFTWHYNYLSLLGTSADIFVCMYARMFCGCVSKSLEHFVFKVIIKGLKLNCNC